MARSCPLKKQQKKRNPRNWRNRQRVLVCRASERTYGLRNRTIEPKIPGTLPGMDSADAGGGFWPRMLGGWAGGAGEVRKGRKGGGESEMVQTRLPELGNSDRAEGCSRKTAPCPRAHWHAGPTGRLRCTGGRLDGARPRAGRQAVPPNPCGVCSDVTCVNWARASRVGGCVGRAGFSTRLVRTHAASSKLLGGVDC